MEMTRKSWEIIRPTGYKGGGTGQRIDDYNGMKPAPLDPVAAQANVDIAIRLNHNLAERRKNASVSDFYDAKAEEKHQIKVKEEEKKKKEGKKAKDLGTSPRDLGEDQFKTFMSETDRWNKSVIAEIQRLKKEVTQAKEAQQDLLLDLANEVAREVKTSLQTETIDKLTSLVEKAAVGDDKLKLQARKLADALLKAMEKSYGIYDSDMAVTGMAVKKFVKLHKVAPETDNYPKGSWGTDIGKLLEKARELRRKLG